MPVRLVWSCAMTATSPEPPISDAILSAINAAAAMLSVAAVETGISLSTPESKPIIGMLASLAVCSSGAKALESTAARQIAAGCLSRAVWNISTCLSTIASVSGPSNVMSTFRSLAAFCAPNFTACQNWCWNPLEMTGMYGLAPVAGCCAAGCCAAGCVAVGAAVGPQAASMAMTSNRDTTTNSFLDISDSSLQGYVIELRTELTTDGVA